MTEEISTPASDVQQLQDNAVALNKLLTAKEDASGGIVRDAGTRFETLARDWLQTGPTYRDRFTVVRTYKERAKAYQNWVLIGSGHEGHVQLDSGRLAAVELERCRE